MPGILRARCRNQESYIDKKAVPALAHGKISVGDMRWSQDGAISSSRKNRHSAGNTPLDAAQKVSHTRMPAGLDEPKSLRTEFAAPSRRTCSAAPKSIRKTQMGLHGSHRSRM